jgi:hypothetical protein
MKKVILENDVDYPNPAEEDGWTLHSFCTRHTNFKDPEECGLGPPDKTTGHPIPLTIGLRRKLETGTAFVCSYYEHGNSIWSLLGEGSNDQWDSTRVAGLLVWDQPIKHLGAKTKEDRKNDARNFLASYTAWANGNAFYFRVEEVTDEEDEDGEEIENGSYLDTNDNLKEMFREIAIACDGDEEIEFEGEASWLMDYHKLPKLVNLVLKVRGEFTDILSDKLWSATYLKAASVVRVGDDSEVICRILPDRMDREHQPLRPALDDLDFLLEYSVV